MGAIRCCLVMLFTIDVVVFCKVSRLLQWKYRYLLSNVSKTFLVNLSSIVNRLTSVYMYLHTSVIFCKTRLTRQILTSEPRILNIARSWACGSLIIRPSDGVRQDYNRMDSFPFLPNLPFLKLRLIKKRRGKTVDHPPWPRLPCLPPRQHPICPIRGA